MESAREVYNLFYEKLTNKFGLKEIVNMFKFREIKEIKSDFETRKLVDDKKEEGFKEIKPETDITAEEARSFIDSLFG